MAYELPKRPTKRAMEQANAVMQLRTDGLTYRQIGEKLGISYQQAYRAQRLALREIPREATEEFIRLQEARVEALMAEALDTSKNTRSTTDQVAAINAALRATDQLNKIRGIYTEQSSEQTDTVGTLLDTLINNSTKQDN